MVQTRHSPHLGICAATMRVENDIGSWATHASYGGWSWTTRHNTPEDNLGVVGSYQWLYEQNTSDILMFIHDDVVCHEAGWDDRLLAEFQDERVALVGFGGARTHGHPDLYKAPYHHDQLQRRGYVSNVDDAEQHGERSATAMDVVVLDGFSLVLRRSVLERLNGFSSLIPHCNFFCYDYALSALVRRLGYRIRYLGIRCHHRGGQTSVLSPEAASKLNNPIEFEKSHRWFYDSFRDVLPATL